MLAGGYLRTRQKTVSSLNKNPFIPAGVRRPFHFESIILVRIVLQCKRLISYDRFDNRFTAALFGT
jgi:hypothetical protein